MRSKLQLTVLAVGLVLLAPPAVAEHGTPGTTQLVSRPTGAQSAAPGGVGYAYAYGRHVSQDGRLVTFTSYADNLSSEDDNRFENCFVRDLQTGVVTLVGRASGVTGAPLHDDCFGATISADGSHIAFVTVASLDPVDTNNSLDVYVRDLGSATTVLASRQGGSPGLVGNGASVGASLDADGKRVAFVTNVNFDNQDSNGANDVYVHDLTSGSTLLVSRAPGIFGAVGDHASSQASIDDAGNRIAFATDATNFDVADTNSASDIYVRNLSGATTALASRVGSAGAVGDGGSRNPHISGDGSTVSFVSRAANLDAADGNTSDDIFVRDLSAGTTALVSRSTAGTVGDAPSYVADLNKTGTKIVFASNASNLTAEATNQAPQIFLRDTAAGTTTLISRADTAAGVAGNSYSDSPAISEDGTLVAFVSASTNFSGSPGPDFAAIYARNLVANTTTLLSRPGFQPIVGDVNNSRFSSHLQNKLSADGRYVVFESDSDGLSSDDDNRFRNIFVRDTLNDTTTLVSRAAGPTGAGANSSSLGGVISADGSTVAFESNAQNLVPGAAQAVNIFVRNLATGAMTVVDAGPSGASQPSLDADGKKLAFETSAALVPADTDTTSDVYVRDFATGTTTLVSRPTGAARPIGFAPTANNTPVISADGTKVAFMSSSTLASLATVHVYERDLVANTTTLVSRATGPAGVSASGSQPAIDADGGVVAFVSSQNDLVPGDTNGINDVFVRNVAAGTTLLVDRANGADGAQAEAVASDPSISADGNRVAFESRAANLSAGDSNGLTDIFVRDVASNTTTLVSAAPAGSADDVSQSGAISGNGDCVAFQSSADDLTPSAPPSDFYRIFERTLSRECPVDPPDTTITSAPPALTKSKTPIYAFTSNDAGASFQCSLDGAAFAACASPFTTPPVADGKHSFGVRAVDAAGYVDATPAAGTWTTDTTPPGLKVAVPKQKLRTVLKRGLRVVLTCNERCTAGSNLFRGKKGIGKATVRLAGAGQKVFFVKLTRKAKRALKHTRSVKLKLRTTAVDEVGNRTRPNIRPIRLRR